jgi:hypothetical protein
MGVWNNNDREESKPQFLNKTEKRTVVRTIRGWEMPLMGSQFAYGLTNGNYGSAVGLTNATVQTELIVCLPNDPSITGVTSSNYAYGFTGQLNGLTFGADFQDQPYFTAPFNGDGGITGVPGAAQYPGSTGVSHGFLTYSPGFDAFGYPSSWTLSASNYPRAGYGYQYGVNAYGVSTLSGLTGVTAYIKIQANDTNLSQSLSMSLSGTYNNISLYTANTLTAGGTGGGLNTINPIPADVYRIFFGPTGDKNGRVSYRQDNIAVLVVGGPSANGSRTVSINVRDNGNSVAPFGSLTGSTAATTFTMVFDRNAGLTTGGGTAGDANAPTVSQYYWTNSSTIRF